MGDKPLKVLYITYLGLLEPIPQAQVIPYLTVISRKAEIDLLSFEKKEMLDKNPAKLAELEKALSDAGIKWHRLRYHKSPPVLSSVYDIFAGFAVSVYLVVSRRISIVHARSNIPIAVAFLLKKLTGVRILYDRRGIMGEEHIENSGWKKDGILHRLAVRFEKVAMRNSGAIVVLTNRMNSSLKNARFLDSQAKPIIETIPCCVNLKASYADSNRGGNDLRKKLDLSGKFVFIYSGSIGTYNLLEEMLDFFRAASDVITNSHFLILSHTPDAVSRAVEDKGIDTKDVTVTFSERANLADFLSLGDAGLIFRRPSVTAIAACPTKFAEYLACGLPVISGPRIGDLEEIINTRKIGVILQGFDTNSYKDAAGKLAALLRDKNGIKKRCMDTAEELFSLERGAESYLNIYGRLNK